MSNFNNQNSCNLDKLHCAVTCGSGEYLYFPLQAKNALNVTNNRAKYYSELAESYKNEAKTFRDNAKLYAEQNSDVTMEYVNNLAADIENKLSGKQPTGDYVTTSEMDENTVTPEELNTAIASVTLPSTENNSGKILSNDGEFVCWKEENYGADTDLSNLTETGEAKFSAKADTDLSNCTKPYVVETYENGNSGYRLWSDKWCEQWGYQTGTGSYGITTVTLLKAFKDTNYKVFADIIWADTWYTATFNASGNSVTDVAGVPATYTTTSFRTQGLSAHKWMAIGYAA